MVSMNAEEGNGQIRQSPLEQPVARLAEVVDARVSENDQDVVFRGMPGGTEILNAPEIAVRIACNIEHVNRFLRTTRLRPDELPLASLFSSPC